MNSKKTLFSVIGYVVVFLTLNVLTQVLVQLGFSLYEGKLVNELNGMGMILSMALFSILVILLFYRAGLTPLSPRYLQSRPFGVMLWCVIASLGFIIPSMFIQEQMPEWPQFVQEYIKQVEAAASQLMGTRGGYFVICILAPVAEEMVFRGAVLRKLLAWKPGQRWAMIVVSALLFALVHMNPAQFIHPLFIGVLLGWMYARTGSIVPGVIFHWTNNTAAYLLFHVYPDPNITLQQVFGGRMSTVLMAVGFSLLIAVPAIYQLNQRMRKE